MFTENVVLEVAVTHEGAEHKASYFIENGVIHTNINGKNLRLPHGHVPVEQTVRAVLIGMLERQGRLAERVRGYRTKMQEPKVSNHVRVV